MNILDIRTGQTWRTAVFTGEDSPRVIPTEPIMFTWRVVEIQVSRRRFKIHRNVDGRGESQWIQL